MSKKKRALRKTIFIACEGRNTEPIYFEKIVEEIEDQGVFAVTIYPDKSDDSPVSHALGLVQEARSRIDDFDDVWVVFDRNGYTKHKEAFDLANEPINGKRVNIAFSSIAFEQWVLLHFIKSNTAFAKSAEIVDFLRANGYFPAYEKKAYIDTYTFLKDRTLQAMENSAWLKHELEKLGLLPAGPLYQLNPYTDVEVLVARLLGINERWVWGSVGAPVKFAGFELMIRPQADLRTLLVEVANLTGNALLYNAANIQHHFFIRSDLKSLSVTIDKTNHILPGNHATFTLTASDAYNGCILEYRIVHYKVMVALL